MFTTKRLPPQITEKEQECRMQDWMNGFNKELDPVFDPEIQSFDEYCEGEPDKSKQVWFRDDKKPFAKPHDRRSFIFHPSFLDSYWDLLEINPEYAKIYIESLMCFGVSACNEVPDIPVIKMALRAPFITIDKAFANFVSNQNKARKEEAKEQRAINTAKQIKEAVKLVEVSQKKWEQKMKNDWPCFLGQ